MVAQNCVVSLATETSATMAVRLIIRVSQHQASQRMKTSSIINLVAKLHGSADIIRELLLCLDEMLACAKVPQTVPPMS